MIKLVVLDMAGTTVADDGLVERAFTQAIGEVGVAEDGAAFPGMLDYVRRTMGESKITVFRHLLDGDEDRAQQANQAFERAYAERVADGDCREIDGAAAAIRRLRDNDIKVALTTGFSETTQRQIIDALGWGGLTDLTLTPAQAGRGRPYPDMVLTALLRLGIDDVREVATVGDTAYDVRSGLRAGASIVAGVLTGAHDRAAFTEAGATHVLESVRDLLGLVLPAKEDLS
ncbi:phosphonatase-like hydrolase [Saccharopolyspora shandongensis]|uniref:Phosphonatase-like hydrolase n=1 Tax=Saccharopolyspora shandongensis TaxID=418495 RepID=A0A1H3PVN2_9PSEU|nr:phosphonatase-like hydrolase [Saccharopolyspora shandongensis]SDZ05372.1 phosphonatase-like hydrolase [Saccharopolyspora shandongensis]